MDQTTTRHRGPGRGLLLIALGTLAIAILAIALVVLRGDQQASYPTGSPEAAYQAFIVAAAGSVSANRARVARSSSFFMVLG